MNNKNFTIAALVVLSVLFARNFATFEIAKAIGMSAVHAMMATVWYMGDKLARS